VNAAGILLTSISPLSSPASPVSTNTAGQKFHIPGRIRFGASEIHHSFFLDSGADANLMDSAFAKQHNIPLVPLPMPTPVELGDGSSSSISITHQSAPIQVLIGEHVESVVFLVMSLTFPLMLGLPWLRRHNPIINWKTMQILFDSEFCLSNCTARAHSVHGFLLDTTKSSNSALQSKIVALPVGRRTILSSP